MKILLIIISMFFIIGCSVKENSTIQENDNVGDEISGVYKKKDNSDNTLENNEFNDEKNSRKLIYAGNGTVKENTYFFTENNACINDNYMIAIVVLVSDSEYALEIGSNCYDRKQQGGMSIINQGEIPIKNNVELEIFDYVKVYYEFPEDFIPESYIDYLNYSTEIEVTGEKLDPLK